MGILLDLIVLAIVALCAFLAMKKGFMKSALELVGFALAIFLSFSFSPKLADFTYGKFVKPAVVKSISDSIPDLDTYTQQGSDFAEAWSELPALVKSSAEKMGIDESSFSNIADTVNNTADSVAESITDNVVAPVANTVLSVLFEVLIFAVVSFAVKVVAVPINKLFSISFAGKLNKLLGALIGAGKGIVYAIVFCSAISAIVLFTKNGFFIFTPENLAASTLFKLFGGINPIF